MLGIRHARAAFAAAILLTALPLALCQVTEGTEGDGWVEIGPDQNDEPGRVTLLQSFNAGYSTVPFPRLAAMTISAD